MVHGSVHGSWFDLWFMIQFPVTLGGTEEADEVTIEGENTGKSTMFKKNIMKDTMNHEP